jgi:cation diffusion facilitator CzcD-associated flavoprotein CzcO
MIHAMSTAPPAAATDTPSAPLAALIVGAGPAGLATAACLKRRGVEAMVLEAGPSLAHSWRHHYDRLRLHTVKQQSQMPGLPFARELPRYPSRADVVAYLEAYAARFAIAPRTGEAVRRVRVEDGGFVVETGHATYRARAVVMAAGLNRLPNPERLPDQERFRGAVIHSRDYRNADRFADQRVLVVGAGNTGAEIALDLAEHGARPTLALRSPVNIVPRDFLGLPTQLTSIRMRRLPLGLRDAIGRLVSRLAFGNLARHGLARPAVGPLTAIERRGRIPIIDVGTIAAIKRGAIAVKPAVTRLSESGAAFADETAAEFDAVVLATGYRPALGEILDVPNVLDDRGIPRDWRGGGAQPNLFFVGYAQPATGLLRQIAIEAEAAAAAIAAAGALTRT